MATVVDGSVLKGERERAELSQEGVARAMNVSVKTVQRMEKAGTVKNRDAAAFRSAIATVIGRPPVSGASPDNVVRRGAADEIERIISRAREAASRYSVRKAQGAPIAELERLRDELEVVVRNGLKAGASDPSSLSAIVAAMVDMLTSAGAPREDSSVRGGARSGGPRRA